MKTYRLSSAAERAAGLLISLLLVLCMVFLLRLLWGDLLSFLICAIACLLVAAALGFYTANLFKAACIPHQEDIIMEVKGYPDSFIYLSDAATLETAAYKNGPVATRTLVFRDAAGEVTATVPTFFTTNQGAQAEPLAMELAQVLGIAFKPTLEPWEYDNKLRKQHQKELAEAEKAARAEKFRSLKAKLLRKGKPTEAASSLSEEEVSVMEETESDGINYDAMDDMK